MDGHAGIIQKSQLPRSEVMIHLHDPALLYRSGAYTNSRGHAGTRWAAALDPQNTLQIQPFPRNLSEITEMACNPEVACSLFKLVKQMDGHAGMVQNSIASKYPQSWLHWQTEVPGNIQNSLTMIAASNHRVISLDQTWVPNTNFFATNILD